MRNQKQRAERAEGPTATNKGKDPPPAETKVGGWGLGAGGWVRPCPSIPPALYRGLKPWPSAATSHHGGPQAKEARHLGETGNKVTGRTTEGSRSLAWKCQELAWQEGTGTAPFGSGLLLLVGDSPVNYTEASTATQERLEEPNIRSASARKQDPISK